MTGSPVCLPVSRLVFVLAVCMPVLGSAMAEPLDLESAIRMALSNNLELARAGIGLSRVALSVDSAHADFATELEPSGAFTTTDGETEWSYGLRAEKKLLTGTELGLEADVTQYPASIDERWRSSVRVDMSQPLFRHAGRLVQREQITVAEESLIAEQRRWELQKAAMVVDVVRAFETLIQLDKQIEGDLAMVERLRRLHDLTKIRERQGRATRVDTLRAELDWGQAKARLENHREARFSTWQDLADLLGQSAEVESELIAPPLPDVTVPEMKPAIALALSNRLDFAQAIQDYESTERGLVLSRRELLPDLDLVAAQEQTGTADAFSDSTVLEDGAWTVGLRGGLDLFNRRGRTAVRGAELDVESARQTILITARNVAREVQQAISAYRQARTEFELAGRNYEIAGARAKLARTLFEMGRGDSFSASDAEVANVEAEATLFSARANASVAGYELLRIMGILTELPDSLKPPLDWGEAL